MTALAETIAAQPRLLDGLLDVDLEAEQRLLAGCDRIWLVGTGTSQHAAELGAWLLRTAGRDARASSSAAFVRFGPELRSLDGVVVISHTGETAFARVARAKAVAAGSRLVSITGRGAGWPEAIETVPREASETYTASYCATLLTLARIGAALGAPGLSATDLGEIPGLVAEAVEAEPPAVAIPERLLVLAGAGPCAVTAREGALKVREAARLPTQGFEAEFLLHGSAVPLDSRDALVLLDPDADPDGLVAAIGAAAEHVGVAVTALGARQGLHPFVAQFPLTARLQALASRMADARSCDPDAVITGGWDDPGLWAIGAPSEGDR